MRDLVYRWTRFWAGRESQMHLDLRGYLQDPELGDGKLLNAHVVPLAALTDAPCLVLLGEPGAGKSRALADERAAQEERIAAAGGSSLWVDVREVASVAELDAALVKAPIWQAPCVLHVFLDSLDESPIGVDAIAAPLLRAFGTR